MVDFRTAVTSMFGKESVPGISRKEGSTPWKVISSIRRPNDVSTTTRRDGIKESIRSWTLLVLTITHGRSFSRGLVAKRRNVRPRIFRMPGLLESACENDIPESIQDKWSSRILLPSRDHSRNLWKYASHSSRLPSVRIWKISRLLSPESEWEF